MDNPFSLNKGAGYLLSKLRENWKKLELSDSPATTSIAKSNGKTLRFGLNIILSWDLNLD